MPTIDKGVDRDDYVLVNVGSIKETDYEYSNSFSTNTYSYPSGVRNEAWVQDKIVDGEFAVNLDSGYAEWLEVLEWRMQNLVINAGSLSGMYGFDGIIYSNLDYYKQAFPCIGDQSLRGMQLVKDLHSWVEDNGSGDFMLGLAMPFNYPEQTGTDSDWIRQNLNAIMINGMQINDSGEYHSYLEMNRRINHAHAMHEAALMDGNTDVDVYALDYMGSPPSGLGYNSLDSLIIKRGMELCARRGWNYNCSPTGSGDLYFIHPLVSGEYSYGYYQNQTGEMLGRKDIPWTKVTGRNKLQQRNLFHELNQALNDDLTYPEKPADIGSISFAITNSRYSSYAGKAYRMLNKEYTNEIDYKFDGVQIGTNTGPTGEVTGSGELEIFADWSGSGDVIDLDLYVYRDPGVRNDLVARRLGIQTTTTGHLRAIAREVNDSGLNGLIDLAVPTGVPGGTPSGEYYHIYLEPDEWYNYRSERQLFIDFAVGKVYNVTVQIFDENGNTLENVEVTAKATLGTLSEHTAVTDSSGFVSFEVDFTNETAIGLDVGDLELYIPRNNVSRSVKMNLIGCNIVS